MSGSSLRHIATLVLVVATLILPAAAVAAQATPVEAIVAVNVANVRSGPGTSAAVIGQLRLGQRLALTGRDAANTWWYGCCANGRSGWISNTVARASGNTAGLPVVTAPAQPTATPMPAPTPATFPEWKAEYFDDVKLEGQPLLVRNDPYLDFNWVLGSPDLRVPADNFSVRWTRRVNFAGGDYLFQARTSDGVRVYLDGLLVLDEWHDTQGYPTYSGTFRGLGAGWHTVTVEYYERGGIAYATVWWKPVAAPQ